MRARAKIDWVGARAVVPAAHRAAARRLQGNAWGWTSARVLGLLAAALVLLAVFVAVERRVDEPLVDMRLMAQRPVWSTNLAAFGVGFAMFGSYILIPELVQLSGETGFGFGRSATVAGIVMLPSALVMLFSGPAAGWLGTRFGSRLPLALGALFAGVAYIDLGLLHATLVEIAAAGVLIGIGIGLAYAAMANLVVQAVRQDQTGVATGINTIMRSIGGAVGAQISASLLAGQTILHGRFPAESGFTGAFLLSGAVALVALLVTALIPRPAGEASGRAVPAVAPEAPGEPERVEVGA